MKDYRDIAVTEATTRQMAEQLIACVKRMDAGVLAKRISCLVDAGYIDHRSLQQLFCVVALEPSMTSGDK